MHKVDHLGIAVHDLEQARKFYEMILGLEVTGVEEVAEQKVRVAMMPLGDTKVELMEPTDPDGAVAKYLQSRGEGIHHVAFLVENLAATLEQLAAQGVKLIDTKPRQGAGGKLIAFLHPKSTHGVLLELCQHNHSEQ